MSMTLRSQIGPLLCVAVLAVLCTAAHAWSGDPEHWPEEEPVVPADNTDWAEIYFFNAAIAPGSGVGDQPGSIVMLLGLRGTDRPPIGGELAFVGLCQIGGTGRGRWTFFPVYLHVYPWTAWRETQPRETRRHPRFVSDVFVGGSAWAQIVSDEDRRAVFLEDGYLHAGVRAEYVLPSGGFSVGGELGAVLARSVEDDSEAELASYLSLTFSIGYWR
jgi:hypothetical protein